MMLETIERLLAMMRAPVPAFTDDYAHRPWDAAQFRIFGPTKDDKVAAWLSSQGSYARAYGWTLFGSVFAAWGVSHTRGMGDNGERLDRIVLVAIRAYVAGARTESDFLSALEPLRP